MSNIYLSRVTELWKRKKGLTERTHSANQKILEVFWPKTPTLKMIDTVHIMNFLDVATDKDTIFVININKLI